MRENAKHCGLIWKPDKTDVLDMIGYDALLIAYVSAVCVSVHEQVLRVKYSIFCAFQ